MQIDARLPKKKKRKPECLFLLKGSVQSPDEPYTLKSNFSCFIMI